MSGMYITVSLPSMPTFIKGVSKCQLNKRMSVPHMKKHAFGIVIGTQKWAKLIGREDSEEEGWVERNTYGTWIAEYFYSSETVTSHEFMFLYTPNYNVDILKLLFVTIFIFMLVKEAFQITFNGFWVLFALFSYLFNLINYNMCTIILSHHSMNHYNSFVKC